MKNEDKRRQGQGRKRGTEYHVPNWGQKKRDRVSRPQLVKLFLF